MSPHLLAGILSNFHLMSVGKSSSEPDWNVRMFWDFLQVGEIIRISLCAFYFVKCRIISWDRFEEFVAARRANSWKFQSSFHIWDFLNRIFTYRIFNEQNKISCWINLNFISLLNSKSFRVIMMRVCLLLIYGEISLVHTNLKMLIFKVVKWYTFHICARAICVNRPFYINKYKN